MKSNMKKLLLLLLTGFSTLAADPRGVLVSSTHTLVYPTDFFTVNSNLIVSAIGGIISGGGSSTNIPTLTGSNAFTGGTNSFAGVVSANTLVATDYATTLSNLHAQPQDTDLDAFAALASNGFVVRAGSGTATSRTVTGTSGRVVVSNGSGVSGDPVIDLDTTTLATSINGGVPNGSGAFVNWSRLTGVPAGFADNSDDGSGGGGTPGGSTGDVQINGGSGTFGAVTKPSGIAYAGALLSRANDGTLSFKSVLDSGWVFWETCLGDPTANYAAGRELWVRAVNGAGTIVQDSQSSGIFGAWRSVVTNATPPDRVAMSGGDGSNRRGVPIQGWTYLLYVEKTRIRNLNTQGSEEARLWHGIMDTAALSATTEPANGVYLRVTNNVWQGVTASGSSYTVSTGPSVVADDYPYVGFYVTQSTNVVFFHGLTPSTLTPFGTNTTTVPAATTGTTIIHTWTKTVGTSGSLTNTTDKIGLYIEP